MNETIDIEDVMRRHKPKVGTRVKRAVLARFSQRHGARSRRAAERFWMRPMPAYLAVSLILITAGASFFAGLLSSDSEPRESATRFAVEEIDAAESVELEWEIAHADII